MKFLDNVSLEFIVFRAHPRSDYFLTVRFVLLLYAMILLKRCKNYYFSAGEE